METTTEQCWNIIETQPIEVTIKKSWSGEYYNIIVEPMLMKYETWQHLGDNLTSEAITYGKERGLIYSPNVEKCVNDVSCSSYDYKTGSAQFSASTEQQVNNWLELYRNIVTKKSTI